MQNLAYINPLALYRDNYLYKKLSVSLERLCEIKGPLTVGMLSAASDQLSSPQ